MIPLSTMYLCWCPRARPDPSCHIWIVNVEHTHLVGIGGAHSLLAPCILQYSLLFSLLGSFLDRLHTSGANAGWNAGYLWSALPPHCPVPLPLEKILDPSLNMIPFSASAKDTCSLHQVWTMPETHVDHSTILALGLFDLLPLPPPCPIQYCFKSKIFFMFHHDQHWIRAEGFASSHPCSLMSETVFQSKVIIFVTVPYIFQKIIAPQLRSILFFHRNMSVGLSH